MSFGPPRPTLTSRPITLTFEIPIGKTDKFWNGLKQGKLITTKCRACGEIRFPPSLGCPNCYSTDNEWIELSRDAEIQTYTHIIVKPASFSQNETYTVAVGKVKEGVKVLAWLTGFKLDEIKVGMKAQLVGKTTEDGKATYEFKPVNRP